MCLDNVHGHAYTHVLGMCTDWHLDTCFRLMFRRALRRVRSHVYADLCDVETCEVVHERGYERARVLAELAERVFFQHLGACRRRTPTRPGPIWKAPKDAPHRDLSDATVRFDLVLGVRRRHAPKSRQK